MDKLKNLTEALKWALPLAERFLESSRQERLKNGHCINIGVGTNHIGLFDFEVAARDRARDALKEGEAKMVGLPNDPVEREEELNRLARQEVPRTQSPLPTRKLDLRTIDGRLIGKLAALTGDPRQWDSHRPEMSVWGDDDGTVTMSVGDMWGHSTRFVEMTPREARRLAQLLVTSADEVTRALGSAAADVVKAEGGGAADQASAQLAAEVASRSSDVTREEAYRENEKDRIARRM